MTHIIKKLFSLSLVVAICAGLSVIVGRPTEDCVVATAVVDYYSGITETEGVSLLGQVHDLITTTHTTYSSYNDCRTSTTVMKTDAGTEDYTVMDFYTQENISATWNGNNQGTWNREHVWCKSLSEGLWRTVENATCNGGTDLHHIRPSEVKLNATRGDNKYGEVKNGTPAYYIDTDGSNKYVGGYVSGSTFEPLDKVKGDVARIVLYVYTHYNTYSNVGGSTDGKGSSTGDICFGTLHFTSIMTASSESAAIELLMKWNEADPVDAIELARNEAVYKIQGNRNPFIDHPEYVAAIWGDEPLESDGNESETPGDNDTQTPGGNESQTPGDNDTQNPGGNESQAPGDNDTQNPGGNESQTPGDNDTQNPGGNESQNPEAENIKVFHDAVISISSDFTLEERLKAICTAIAAYGNLSENAQASASDDFAALQAAISEYNREVILLNSAASGADKAGLSGYGISFKDFA